MYFIQYLQNIYNDYTPKLQLHYLLLSIKYLHNIYAQLPATDNPRAILVRDSNSKTGVAPLVVRSQVVEEE